MKNLLVILTIIFSCTVNAQDVTKFLGIPVDGSKSEMIQKLKALIYEITQMLIIRHFSKGRQLIVLC